MAVAIHALADEHVAQVVVACADWQELAQFGPPYWRPRSPAELRRKIAATAGPQPSTEYSFVSATDDGKLVGECSVHAIDWRNRCAQIGVCIWAPGDRRRGYGRTAAQHAIDWASGYLGLTRLEAWIVGGNEPSIGLFQGFGFEYEGTLRGRYLHAGTRHDMQLWALVSPS
ncbi:N-acetyltransferase [Mycobacteroides abscessus]|nr:N-acetyltransferase [Mycobacteroides abscessus]SKT87742.1 putative acetyltransferase [Mycobacteroides abscessus subsp. massiliense]SKU07688.1 putative acetyltransferase [Mycobacteroides abscessus subsp. massiliense]